MRKKELVYKSDILAELTKFDGAKENDPRFFAGVRSAAEIVANAKPWEPDKSRLRYDCLSVDLIDRNKFSIPEEDAEEDDLDELHDFLTEVATAKAVDAIPVDFIDETIDFIHRELQNAPTSTETALNWLKTRWRRYREMYQGRAE